MSDDSWRYVPAAPPCFKATFRTEAAAREAHSYLPFGLRVYWCRKHKGYHVSSTDAPARIGRRR